MNDWVAVPPAFVAVIVSLYVPPWPTPGVPASVAVPLPLSTQARPCGRAPDSASVGAGAPVVLTVKLNAEPSVALALFAVVIVGFALTVSTNDWVVVPAEFFAVKVSG